MTISQISNLMSIPIGAICLGIAIRALYIYRLSLNDMIAVLGFSMLLISMGTFAGTVGDTHLWGNHFNTEWVRAFGACSGGLFIFLSSLVKSHIQMQKLRRWQTVTLMIFIAVVLLTPLYPPVTSPLVTLALNSCRMIVYFCAFTRYLMLYASKATHFSLMMTITFSILLFGYALNIPGILHTGLALVTIIAAGVRIVAYLMLLASYLGA